MRDTININFYAEGRPNYDYAVSEAFIFLAKKYIYPHESEMDQEELSNLLQISNLFLEVGEKAEAYSKMQEEGFHQNLNSLN